MACHASSEAKRLVSLVLRRSLPNAARERKLLCLAALLGLWIDGSALRPIHRLHCARKHL